MTSSYVFFQLAEVWLKTIFAVALETDMKKTVALAECVEFIPNLVPTVDGRNPANHLGCINPVNNGIDYLLQDFFHQQYVVAILIGFHLPR